VHILVRLRNGVVGETRRVVHVVPLDEEHVLPDGLVTCCRLVIRPGTAERIDGYAGMPCEGCGLAVLTSTPPALDQ
jgi:hypothetical protein